VRQSVYFKERALVNEPGFPLPIKSSISISKYSRQVEQLLDLPRNQEQWICSLLVDPGQTRNHQDPDYAETLITETFGKDMWRILSKRRKARVRLFYDEDFDQLAPSHSQLKKNRKFWIPTTFTELVLGLLENRERQRIAQSGGSLSCLLRSENLALYVPYVWEAHHPKKGFYNKQVG
jgi:hypothetical protein